MDIILRHVWRSFGEKQVLRDFSHTFPQGELTVVMGPSGCGKTTLLSLLLGLQAPDRGEILGLEGLKKSAVFQEDRLCENTTAQANLRLVNPALTREQANQALTALGLGDSLSQPVREFSGGMKRRVAILRALLAPYDVLLCDEPFQGLDQDTKALVLTYFREKTRGKTVILVLHEINYAAFYSDYICAFLDGKIAKFGTVAEVMTKETLSAIYQVDFEIMEIERKPLSIYY